MEPKYVSSVRKSISYLAAEEGYLERDCQDIEVAIGEAVTNAISHGQPVDGKGRVRVHCQLTPTLIIIEVEDESQATCLPMPNPAPDADSEHGRGWLLIHRLMDRVSVRCTEKGMLVRMIKQKERISASSIQDIPALQTI
jgi:serine/threonine-protein kinase RsbW